MTSSPHRSARTGPRGADGFAVGAPAAFPPRGADWAWLVAIGIAGALLGYLGKARCRFGGAWLDGTQYQSLCYSDVFALYYRDGLDAGTVPYLDQPVEYPVLTGGLMHLMARAASWLPDPLSRGYGYFDATAAVLGACLVATVVCVGRLAGRGGVVPAGRPFDRRAALVAGGFVALAPAAVLTFAINWDLLAVALAVGGIACYARERLWAAGALTGLAVAAKFYPFLFFGPLFVLMVRDLARGGAGRDAAVRFGVPLLGALLAWGAVNLPVYLVSPEGWAEFFTFSQERGADWGSVYYVLGALGLFPSADLGTVNLVGTGTLLLACVGIALLGLFAPRRPPVEQLLFLVVAAFLVTNKVWSPQFVLWLLPLAALAWPRSRRLRPAAVVLFGLWQLAEVGYIVGIWHYLWYYQSPAEEVGVGLTAYAVVTFGRLLSLLMVCALVVVDSVMTGLSELDN
ncbi:glycosyltransferase family 87 protein [Thermobifida cellulosilytica]|uniref:Uncharacterized protein n=1 Tax=Thermobifida cellulosilytica TB100 TaxID=665004 RepID=A0A147KLM1_THECS|nr:DUF2029 domain-containing protein [Thermobifida cellulosilytica]KUP98225.1 hypothetical protein AC529_02860 [Thermobifida cellulosilytica TB100]